MIPLKGVLHWTRHKLKALAGSEVLPCNGHCPSNGTAAQSLSNYTMIFLKWNRLNRNCSGSVYHREIMNIASERPLQTIYAKFFTFWVAAL